MPRTPRYSHRSRSPETRTANPYVLHTIEVRIVKLILEPVLQVPDLLRNIADVQRRHTPASGRRKGRRRKTLRDEVSFSIYEGSDEVRMQLWIRVRVRNEIEVFDERHRNIRSRGHASSQGILAEPREHLRVVTEQVVQQIHRTYL